MLTLSPRPSVSLVLPLLVLVLLSESEGNFQFNRNTGSVQFDASPWHAATNDSFDFYVYAQQWAPSVCMDAYITHEHKCQIPSNVTTWTVHGLWPTRHGSHEPSYCNSTAKFNASALQPIHDDLLKFWPNLYTDTPMNDFWEHEWTKHGTCAEAIPDLNSELKFFNFSLQLNRKHDLLKMLDQQGVKPRNDYTYQYVELLSAVQKAAGGHKVNIQCTYDKVTKTQYLLQIEVCLSKEYQLMDCEDSSSFRTLRVGRVGEAGPCQDTVMVAYPKLHSKLSPR